MPVVAARKHFPTFLRWGTQLGPGLVGLASLGLGLWGGLHLALGLWAQGPGLEAEAIRRLGDRLAPELAAQQGQALQARGDLVQRLRAPLASPGAWPQALAADPNVAQAWELWPDGRLWQAERGQPAQAWQAAAHLPEAQALAQAQGAQGTAPWRLGAGWVPHWPSMVPQRHPLEAIRLSRRALPAALPGEKAPAFLAARLGPGPLRILRLQEEAFLPSLAERQDLLARVGLKDWVAAEWQPGPGLEVAGPRTELARALFRSGWSDREGHLLGPLMWGEDPWRTWTLGYKPFLDNVPYVAARHHRPTEAGLRWVRLRSALEDLLGGLVALALATLGGRWAWPRLKGAWMARPRRLALRRTGALWRLGLGLGVAALLGPIGAGLVALGVLEGRGPWGVVRAHQAQGQDAYQALGALRRAGMLALAKEVSKLPKAFGPAWTGLIQRPEVQAALALDAQGQPFALERRWLGMGRAFTTRWVPLQLVPGLIPKPGRGREGQAAVGSRRARFLTALQAELLGEAHQATTEPASVELPEVGLHDAIWRGSAPAETAKVRVESKTHPHLVWRGPEGQLRLYLRLKEDAFLDPKGKDGLAMAAILAKQGLSDFEADPFAYDLQRQRDAVPNFLVRLGLLSPPLLRPQWANGVPEVVIGEGLGLQPKPDARAWPGLLDRILAGLLLQVLAMLALRQAGLAVRQLSKEGAEDFAGGALAAGVAHELRTPLTALKLDAELLASGLVPPEGQGAIAQRLAQQVGRLERRLDDVMAWGRLASGHGRAATEPYAPLAVAEQALEEAKPLLAARGLSASLQGEAPPGPWYGDPAALRRALVELLANAAKHGAGPVELRLEAEGWSVRDHGPGLGARERKQAFVAFERLGATAQGAGLGLALVQEVATSHGGQAQAEAAEGGGLRVRLRVAEQPA